MKILVACEFSGLVRDAFRAKGHEAVSCDLLPSESRDNSAPHIQGNVLDYLDQGWDMLIAFPPCTYLCSSGLHWNRRNPERVELTEKALEFVKSLLFCDIEKIALENPVGCISSRIRKPDQVIQPYMFGEDASKKTCLWLKNLPPLLPTMFVPGRLYCCGVQVESDDKYGCPNCNGDRIARRIWNNQTPSGQNKLSKSPIRWKLRSITYRGIANAMAEQWG